MWNSGAICPTIAAFVPQGIKEEESRLAPLIGRLRSLTLAQPGYISGETLKCIDPEQ
jgi:hypothetical protein